MIDPVIFGAMAWAFAFGFCASIILAHRSYGGWLVIAVWVALNGAILVATIKGASA